MIPAHHKQGTENGIRQGETSRPYLLSRQNTGNRNCPVPCSLFPVPSRRRSGFTLLEALIALVMFTIITFALSLALSTAVRSHDAAQKREHDASTVRSVFSIVSRDIQGAFISKRNPASVFIANNGGSGSSSRAATTGSLLTFTTMSYRVQPGDLNDPVMNPDGNAQQEIAAVTPQADFALIRYDLDTASNTLTRSVVPVPNLDLNREPSGTPDAMLSDRITSLTLRFYDPAQKTWRNDWDYQQTNQGTSAGAAGTDPASADNPADPLSGVGAGTGNTGANSSAQQEATGDTSFPSAVEMTITILRSDNTQATYKTMIPIITPYLPQDPPTTTGAAGTGAAGAGGANSNGTQQPRN